MKKIVGFVMFVLALASGGCGSRQTADGIAVTIEPQRYFAEKIVGGKMTVYTVVPAGQSPEVYDPTPRQMMQIGKCRAYLRIGPVAFEQAWMRNIRQTNPRMQVFDLSEGFTFITETGETDEHHHEHHHAHPGDTDPHIWSSVEGAKVIAGNTLKAITALDPENETFYRQNYASVMSEIEETEATLHRMLDSLACRAFIIYHPALTYFAEEFNLMQLCIETDGKEPSPAQLKELVDTAKEYKVEVVFIQQEFDQKNAERMAEETGCRLVALNLLDYHWSKEMIQIAKALAGE